MRAELHRQHESGMTVVEIMMVLVIVTVLMTIGVPAFTGMVDRHRIKAAADTLHTDLQFSRAEAIRSNGNACVGFVTGSNWCYGMNLAASGTSCETATCSCSVSDTSDPQYCSLRRVVSTDFPNVELPNAGSVTFPSNVTGFEPTRGLTGTSTGGAPLSGSATLQSAQGRQATVSLTAIGRATVCSPTSSVPGYPAC